MGPDRVKTRTAGRQFMNFSRFSAFSAITGPAERKNSLQMRRFQTISEISHRLDPNRPFDLNRRGASTGRSSAAAFDDFVGPRDQRLRDVKAERLRGLGVDYQLEPGRLLDRQIGR